MDVVTISNIMASVLILSGIVFTGIQLYKSLKGKELSTPRGFNSEVGPVKFNIQTTYPGLIIIGLGILLFLATIIKSG